MNKLNFLAFAAFIGLLCPSCSNSDEYPDWKFVPKTSDSDETVNPAADFEIGSTVGYSDNSSEIWTAYSDEYIISANNEGHIRFVNHSLVYDPGDGHLRHDYNFILQVMPANGTTEYFNVRPDCFGWGGTSYVEEGVWTSEGFDYTVEDTPDNWEEWSNNMNGAVVDATITRDGDKIVIQMVSTCANGTIYKATYSGKTQGNSEDNIKVRLSVDHCYLEIDAAGMELEFPNPEEPDDTPLIAPFEVDFTVGNTDCTSGFLSTFSPYYTIGENSTSTWTFFNLNNGGGEWNNWLMLVSTMSDFGDTGNGYSEYIVRRADPNSWRGNAGSVGTWTSSGFEGDDWKSEFVQEMNGAVCTVTCIREGATLTINAKNVGRSGKIYTSNVTIDDCAAEGSVRAFFSVDGSCLQFKKDGYTTTNNE